MKTSSKAKYIKSGYFLRTADNWAIDNIIAVDSSGYFLSNRVYWTFDAALPVCIV